MFFVQYNKELFPQDESKIVTTLCKTRRKALEFLRDEFRKNGLIKFYAPVIFNEDRQKFVTITKFASNFIYGTEIK